MSTTQQKKAPLFNRSSRSKLRSQMVCFRSTPLLSVRDRRVSKNTHAKFRGNALHRISSKSRASIFLARLSLAEIIDFHFQPKFSWNSTCMESILDSVSVISYCASVECLLMNKVFALALCVLTLKIGCFHPFVLECLPIRLFLMKIRHFRGRR